MSRKILVDLMHAAAEDERLAAKLQSARGYDQWKDVAKENGFDLGELGAEEARRTIGVMTGRITDELTDAELELVAGGISVYEWMTAETSEES